MRKIIVLLCLLVVVLFVPQNSSANADDDIYSLMNNFFYNVSNGFKGGTLAFMADPMLTANKAQLSNNPAYPAFLRKIYANSRMVIKNIETIDDDTKAVDVEIFYKNETMPKKRRYIVIREMGMWKVSDEVVD